MKKHSKVLIALAAAAALTLALAGCGSNSATSSSSASSSSSSSSSSADASSSAASSSSASSSSSTDLGYTTKANKKYIKTKHSAVVTVKGYAPFTIELDADSAPVTVSNFATLADKGYYDGLAFYRVVDGFCLQGGTKGNTASGNDTSLTPIIGEFASNNVTNKLAEDFGKGVVAMARTSEANSATSTFFITLASGDSVAQSLNKQYAAFGTIDKKGMKIVDKIVSDHKDADTDSMGVIADEKDMPIIQSIKIK